MVVKIYVLGMFISFCVAFCKLYTNELEEIIGDDAFDKVMCALSASLLSLTISFVWPAYSWIHMGLDDYL